MSSNFTLENIKEFMDSSCTNMELNLTFPENIGKMCCIKEFINDDISIYKTCTKVNKNISIQTDLDTDGIDTLFINIMLNGKVQYKANNFDKIETINKNDTYIKYIDKYSSTAILDKDNLSKGLAISIKKAFFEKYLSKHLNLLEDMKNHKNNTCTYIHRQDKQKNLQLASEIFNSPFINDLHNIYIQSKILEIIYSELNDLVIQKTKPPSIKSEKIKLSSDDIERLYKAKEIILLSKEFCDLSTLSKKVALNEFKLKYGFKKVFNTTPGQMMLEHKMVYAKQLLETSEFSIKEISNFVGYKYQQSFTNAFFQFFKILPKDIMKTRKYYY